MMRERKIDSTSQFTPSGHLRCGECIFAHYLERLYMVCGYSYTFSCIFFFKHTHVCFLAIEGRCPEAGVRTNCRTKHPHCYRKSTQLYLLQLPQIGTPSAITCLAFLFKMNHVSKRWRHHHAQTTGLIWKSKSIQELVSDGFMI